jgi:hypothetical protein
VHFEAILIAHLALADLTVPSQPLKSFRLELIIEELRGSNFCFRHLEWSQGRKGLEGRLLADGENELVRTRLWVALNAIDLASVDAAALSAFSLQTTFSSGLHYPVFGRNIFNIFWQ